MNMFCSRTGHITEIIEVKVDRQSQTSVWMQGRVYRKMSSYECYHETFQAAKDHLVAEVQQRVKRAEQSLLLAQQALAKVQAIKPPSLTPPTAETSTELGFYQ